MKTLNLTATALLVVLIFYLLKVGQALLLPLVIAITLWYLINTLAIVFARIPLGQSSIPKPVSLMASFLTFTLLVWALISFLGGSLDEVTEVIPNYQENLEARFASLPFMESLNIDSETVDMAQISEWVDLPQLFTSFAGSFASILASGGIILIYMGFLFLEQGHFDRKISNFIADPARDKNARQVISRIREDIQKYISIKMFTSSATGILSYIFLRIVEVDFAGVWGLLIFLLNFIPTVGSIIATIFPALIALAQSDGYSLFILVLLGIGALQVCIGNILEPRLMGNSFNLSPLVILLNLGLWNYIWGVVGMFLCVPLLIIITIVLSYFPQTRPIAVILSSDGQLRPTIDKAPASH
jgi:predicted PurR-regulated permease PerM